MDIQRIYHEVAGARERFALVELHPTNDGGVFVKAGIHTSAARTYIVAIYLTNYPSLLPKVFVTVPGLAASSPHRYKDGNICYLHPNMWNPGLHNLIFVLARIAKWLNKYEVWRVRGIWPGAEIRH